VPKKIWTSVSGVVWFVYETCTDFVPRRVVDHRGGPPGFVRIMSPTEIVYPEYSGNRLYQSLGNLQLNPKVGLTFPDYETGNVLYITGTAEILVSADAARLLPGSNLAVKINITEAHLVQRGLPFRGTKHDPSPYNPRLRPLAGEGNIKSTLSNQSNLTIARLVAKKIITPTIARFTFSAPSGIVYSPGQWVAMDFKSELDIGYEHMRDDDPTSLNDDFIRTFTISSTPDPDAERQNEFEITVRRVGPVTRFLYRQSERAEFEVPILGVGGDFKMEQSEESGLVPFVAGGVGITPLLSQLSTIDPSPIRFQLLWTLKVADTGLVLDTLQRFPRLAQSTTVFLTGGLVADRQHQEIERIRSSGAEVKMGRITKDDVNQIDAETWYICAGKTLRQEMLSWLQHRKVVFEDFDY
jgi:ferredoxin-NADP reductase